MRPFRVLDGFTEFGPTDLEQMAERTGLDPPPLP